MPTAFETYAANSRQSLYATHGEAATYTADGAAGVSVIGTWEDGAGRNGMGSTLETREDRELVQSMGIWTMSTDDVETVTVELDSLTRGGIEYTVIGVTTEGGLHRCECVSKSTRSVGRRERRHGR